MSYQSLYNNLLEFCDFMMSREDGKHYKKNELDEIDLYELMDHEYRIIYRKQEEERLKELQELDNSF